MLGKPDFYVKELWQCFYSQPLDQTVAKIIGSIEQIRRQKGPKGDPGAGVPQGGSPGQVLAKKSSANYDTEWVTGGGGGTSDHAQLTHLDYASSGHTGFASSIELAAKQDALTAGSNISIEGATISATDDKAVWGSITGDLEDQTDLAETLEEITDTFFIELAAKQDKHVTASASLSVAGWSGNQQTVSVAGVTASNTVIVSAAPADLAAYAAAGIYCSAQGAGTLTFACATVPTAAISVQAVIL